jgi:adenylate cyclase
MTTTRRLAAILAADVAGYSRLMGADEVGTLEALKSHRRSIVDPAIAAHHGRIVKTTGDGLLVEFASAVDAVNCAMTIQEQMAQQATNGTQPHIQFRIGINIGDIISEGDDIFGDGVNVAARVENECEPGGVYLSGSAHEQVAGKTKYTFEDVGEKALKNIVRPVRLFAVTAANGSLGSVPVFAEVPLQLPDRPSIAVLPFQNMSGDPEQEFFADGMVEDIITALSRFKSLFVIARNSSFTFKGQAVDIKQVGQKLGAQYILEGSVRKIGERVRITGQLIEAATGAHLWADKFDGALADVFELQDSVTISVVGAIAPKLTIASQERVSRKPVESLEAYELYLRCSISFRQWTLVSMREALQLARRVIELDPSFGLAHARAANCMYQLFNVFNVSLTNVERQEALRLAEAGIQLANDDERALTAAAFPIGTFSRDFERAANVATRAVELNPNSSAAFNTRGWMRINLGQPEQAMEDFARALRLNPLDPNMVPNICSGFAVGNMLLRKPKAAIEWAQRTLSYRPKDILGLFILAGSAHLADLPVEAQSAARRFREAYPTARRSHMREAYRLVRPEDDALVRDVLDVLGLPE